MSRRGVFAAVAAAVFVIGITFVAGWFSWRQVRRTASQALTPFERQNDLTALVTRVRALNRLETATMRVVHVSTITQSYALIPDAIAGDEMTLLATGDVIAGIDLSQLRRKDVHREADGTIVVRLPAPEILVSRLDNRQSRVLARKTGLFRRADAQLEGRARAYAEESIRNEAVKKGLLQLASQNAELRMAEILHMFGFPRVRCEVAEASPSQG